MNILSSSLLLTLAMTGAASATVTVIGVDSTAGPNWRTGALIESDGQYGTSGYVVFGLNADNNVYTQPFEVSIDNPANAYHLPAGIEVSTADSNIGMWSGNGNFGEMQDPASGILTAVPVLANSGGTRQFTISRTVSAAYRLTFLTASGDNEGTGYTLSVDDGSGARTSTYDHVTNGLAYHVYDITEGTEPIVVDISSDAQNRSLTGIAFDPVPLVLPPPGFTSQPLAVTVVQGGPATFSATAAGAGVTLQWQRNSTDVPGAVGASYTLTTTAADQGAAFRCVATNGSGTTISDPATLTLVAPAPRSADYRAAVDAEASRLAFFPFDGDSGTIVTNAEDPLTGGTISTGALTGLPSMVVGTTALAGSAALTADAAWEFADDSTGTVEAFVFHSAATPAYNPCLFSIRQTSTNVRMSLHADAAGNKFYFWNGANAAVWNAPVNTIGRRSHLAFVFDNGNVSAFMDGIPLGTQAVALGTGSGLPAQIGASDGGTAEPFPGSVDELAIYGDALSEAGIAAHSAAWYGPLPEITTQPQSQTVVEGAPVQFSVSTRGPDLTYQWQRNEVNLPGTTSATLRILSAAADHGAAYRCMVSNPAGSLTSDPATLTLVAPAPQTAAYRAAVAAESSRLAFFPFDGDSGPAVTNTLSALNGGILREPSFLSGMEAQVVGTTALSGTAGLTSDPAWEFPDGTGSVEAVVYQSASAGYNPCFFSIRDTGAVRYSLHGATDGSKLHLWNGAAVSIWNTPKSMIGRRTHIVITFDNDSVSAYFDGIPLGTLANGLGSGSGLSAQIGSSTQNSDELWPGTVDEVALYGDVLSPGAVDAHASAWFGAMAVPVIKQAGVSSGLIFLTVPSTAGLSYSLEASPDLITPWTAAGPVTAGTGEDLILSTTTGGTAGYYRVRASR